ncbi:MAG: L-threonylcarbamoyladenylate synthase, partial [Bdellovibrionales bacterium]
MSLSEAVELLKSGELVAIPTETVYGLAARIDREDSLRKIFTIKERPFFDPLIVHVHSVEQARPLVERWPSVFDVLTASFWPGPLTLVAPKTSQVSSLITSGLTTVAIRSPDHPLARQVLREVGVPLAAPSANRFGRTSPTRAEHVEQEFGTRIAVLDGGACTVGVESTVLQAEEDNEGVWRLHVLRPGGISRAQIVAAMEKSGFKYALQRTDSVASPGHLKAHYQPAVPVVIVKPEWAARPDLKNEIEFRLGKRVSELRWLNLPSTPEMAARALYQELRTMAQAPDAVI